eukprot:jgi/Mesvir1/6330/Mv16270-RA.1
MAATGDHDAAMDAASNAGDDARMSDSASSDDGGSHAAIRWSQPAKHALLKRLNSGRVVVFSLPTQRGRGAKKTEKTPRQIGWDEVGADLDASMEFMDPKDRLPKGYATGEKCQKQYKALKAALKQKKASPVDVDDPDSSIEQEILHLTKVVMGLEAAAKSKKKQGKVPQQDARPAEIGAHVRAAAMSSRGSKRAAPDLDPPAGEHPDESQEGGQAGEEYAGEEEEWEEGDEMGGQLEAMGKQTDFLFKSFTHHLLRLMTSWAVVPVCDVWYLEPQTQQEGETPEDFADRVKRVIAQKAGIKPMPWDGVLVVEEEILLQPRPQVAHKRMFLS